MFLFFSLNIQIQRSLNGLNKNNRNYFQMHFFIPLVFSIFFPSASFGKVTYCKKIVSSIDIDRSIVWNVLVNLENTYGPYCNPNNKFTPDAGVVRYAGWGTISSRCFVMSRIFFRTPWVGKCVLNLESCCLPMHLNGTLFPNMLISTRFYLHLLVHPLCSTENVTIQAESGETVRKTSLRLRSSRIFFFRVRLGFYRLSHAEWKRIFFRHWTNYNYLSSIWKTSTFKIFSCRHTDENENTWEFELKKIFEILVRLGMYSPCGFDCFSDTYCIHTSLVCDRYRNCPNNVDEAHCEYSSSILLFHRFSIVFLLFSSGHHHEPLSFRAKIILFAVLMTILTLAVSSILICYLCCGIVHNNRLSTMTKDRKQSEFERKIQTFFRHDFSSFRSHRSRRNSCCIETSSCLIKF